MRGKSGSAEAIRRTAAASATVRTGCPSGGSRCRPAADQEGEKTVARLRTSSVATPGRISMRRVSASSQFKAAGE
jgi:hypothetical protein